MRLEQQHLLLKELLSDFPHHRLYPEFVGEPREVLDLGFGTASWCSDVGLYDPDCNVRRLASCNRQ